jgi:glycosyltransferase involved in cell wall biosynthesis/CMP-N-acetylneuraminic acid synthetase
MRPKVTVYIPSHDYGRYLAQAVESVLSQSYDDWELIIVDDGSLDETRAVADRYAAAHAGRIRVLRHATARGLQACANLALEEARGEYILRLDADDYLDENALLVLATYLDNHPEVGLVYPNYVYVDELGRFLGLENRKKVGKEANLLDLPALGACTMVRKRVLKTVGGYSEDYTAQDGQELWLKVVHRFPVANVSTPLFFYRQHADSLSHDRQRILDAREQIKRNLVERGSGKVKPRIVAIVPAKNSYKRMPDVVLAEVAGRPLIDYTLDSALGVEGIGSVFVTTDDPGVVEYCERFEGVVAAIRPAELSAAHVTLDQVLHHAVLQLESEYDTYADILVLLSVHSPLRRSEHIRKAIDTLLLYDCDSVISVYEDYDLHFTHGADGLEPLNPGMRRRVRLEREALYVDNGAIRVSWRDALSETGSFAGSVGHIVMPVGESLQIKSPFDAWMIEQIIGRDRRCP